LNLAIADRTFPPDALLVTDRVFMRSYDGSAAIYTAWLAALKFLGFRVSVVSFNQARVRWTDADLAELSAESDNVLILDAFRNTAEAALIKAEQVVWSVLAGRRYAPSLSGRRHMASNTEHLTKFVTARRFTLIVVNKTSSIRLLGKVLDQTTGCKLLDVHDNLPRRARMTRSVALRLLASNPQLVRSMRVEELGNVLGWASERRLMCEEIRQFKGFDGILFPAVEEKRAFVSAGLEPSMAHVIPWPIPSTVQKPARSGSFHVGFIGSSQLFNFEALDFLVREVLPRVRQDHPGLRVLIAGSIVRPAETILRHAGVELIPWVEQVADFYRQVDVVVVPLLSGTGVSVKTVEAAVHGSSIVTTPVGLRGLALRHEREILVAEGGANFAAAISRLLNDPASRVRLGAAAAAAVAANHSLEAFCRATRALLPSEGLASGKGRVGPTIAAEEYTSGGSSRAMGNHLAGSSPL
jgi:glycosyltransferase involved in cell wall biosynthesis